MSKRLVEFVPQAYIDEKLAELRAIEAPAMISRGEALALLKDEIIRLAGKGHSTADILKRLNSGAQVIRKADIDGMLSKSPKKPHAARKRAIGKSASAQSPPENDVILEQQQSDQGAVSTTDTPIDGTAAAQDQHEERASQEQMITAFSTGVVIPTEKASDV